MRTALDRVHFRPVYNLWLSLATRIDVDVLPQHPVIFWTLRGSYL